MKNTNEIIGLQIKKLREEKKLTQENLARILHTSKQNISRYENGIVQIPLQTINDIASFFNVSIDFLFAKTNVKNYNQKDFFTDGEKSLVIAYRSHPEMHDAINKILGINDISTYSIEDDLIETNTKITVPTNKK
ncbi:MAG: helix-turn-helix transcriptional regulator [Clostridia bacterium]|nr:helix-turn-helix transcriptional regulator [Clostridia bacterium]